MTGREYVNERIKHLHAIQVLSWIGFVLLAIPVGLLLVISVGASPPVLLFNLPPVFFRVFSLFIAIALLVSGSAIVIATLMATQRRLACPNCRRSWGQLLEEKRLTVGYILSEEAELCPYCGYRLDDELPANRNSSK